MSRSWPCSLLLLLATGALLAADPPEAERPARAAEEQEQAAEGDPHPTRAAEGQAPTEEGPEEARPAEEPAQTEEDGAATEPVDEGPKELSGMSILGNREAPKSLVIVPWKSSELGEAVGISTLLDDSRQPVDKEVFLRALSYYDIRSERTP